MIDILLLAGVALCALSVLLAIVSVVRTQAPRGAAIALALGLVLLFVGSWRDPRQLGLQTLYESWHRLVNGQVVLGTDPVTTPAPETADVQPPAEAPAVEAPEADTPAAEEPAPEVAPADIPAAESATDTPAADAPDATTDATEGEASAEGQ